MSSEDKIELKLNDLSSVSGGELEEWYKNYLKNTYIPFVKFTGGTLEDLKDLPEMTPEIYEYISLVWDEVLV